MPTMPPTWDETSPVAAPAWDDTSPVEIAVQQPTSTTTTLTAPRQAAVVELPGRASDLVRRVGQGAAEASIAAVAAVPEIIGQTIEGTRPENLAQSRVFQPRPGSYAARRQLTEEANLVLTDPVAAREKVLRAQQKNTLPITDTLFEASSTLRALKEDQREVYGANPQYDNLLLSDIASGVGSSLPTAVTALATGGAALPAYATTALQLYQENFDSAVREGKDLTTAHQSGLFAMPLAYFEKFGDIRLGKLLRENVENAFETATVRAFAKKKWSDIIQGAVGEGATEVAQTGGSQEIESALNIKKRTVDERLTELTKAFVVGAGAGGAISTTGAAGEATLKAASGKFAEENFLPATAEVLRSGSIFEPVPEGTAGAPFTSTLEPVSEVPREARGTAGEAPALPVPERPETIAQQLAVTLDPASTKAVTLVTPLPDGSYPALPPDAAKLSMLQTPHGIALFHPAKTTRELVEAGGQQKDFPGTLLGFSTNAKPEPVGNTVVQTTLGGVPVLDEVVAPTPESIAKASEAHKLAVPGGETQVVPAEKVLEERQNADTKLLDLLGSKHDLTGQQSEMVMKAFRSLTDASNPEALQKAYLKLAVPSDMPQEVGLGKVAGLSGAKEVLRDLREASAGDTALPVRQAEKSVGRNERKSPPTGQPDEGARETGLPNAPTPKPTATEATATAGTPTDAGSDVSRGTIADVGEVGVAEVPNEPPLITPEESASLVREDTTPSETVTRMQAEEAAFKARRPKQTGAELQKEYEAQEKAKAATPAKAAAKMQEQVSEVATKPSTNTIGQKRLDEWRRKQAEKAKWVKSELVERLEAAIAELPTDGSGTGTVTIDIPGDGTFKIRNNKDALNATLKKAKALDVKATPVKTKVGKVARYGGFISKANEVVLESGKLSKSDLASIHNELKRAATQAEAAREEAEQGETKNESTKSSAGEDTAAGDGNDQRQARQPDTQGVVAQAQEGQVETPISMGGQNPADVGELRKAQLAQLTDSVKTLAESGKVEVAKAFDVGESLAGVKESISGALEGLRAVGIYLKQKLEGKPVVTDWRRMLGDRHLALSESALNARKWMKQVLKGIPDPRVREAISNWVDTGGDDALLAKAATETKARYKAGYELARKLTPEQLIVAQNLRNYFESRLQEAMDAGVLEDGIENYIHRIYEAESDWKKGVIAELRSDIFTGRPALAKQRVFEYDFEAEKAGKAPIKDFAKRVVAYDLALNKSIADRAAVKAMMEIKMADGRPMIDVGGGGKVIEGEDGKAGATFIDRSRKRISEDETENRGDYKAYDHPALRKWKWAAADANGNPIFVQGDVLVHPEAMRQIRVLFDRSAVRQNPVGNLALKFSSTIKQTMLDLSLFHQVQIGIHGMEHKTFKPVTEIDFTNPDVRGLIKGGATVGETSGRELFSEGLAGSSLTRHIPWVGRQVQAYQEYLFGDYIPRLKMAMGLHALERNRERFPKLTAEQQYQMTAGQMNAAFGELNYEMMGRSKTMQDALRLTLLAPDFLEARSRFVAQAFTKLGKEQRVALLLGAGLMFVTARILNKLLNDEYHWEEKNWFSVVYKGRSYGLRTVQGDLIHAVTDPGKFTNHRLNPVYGRPVLEFVTGRDYFGRERDLADKAKDMAMTPVPISLRGMFSGQETTLLESFLNSIGAVVKRDSPSSDIAELATKWKEANKVKTLPGEFIYDADKDPFRDIKLAAERGDESATRSEVAKAITGGLKRSQIIQHFSISERHLFTGSAQNEKKFVESLTDDQKKIYADARAERKRIKEIVIRALR